MAINRALVAFKKLFNRPQTSNDKQLLANEELFVGFQHDSFSIFAQRANPLPPGDRFFVNTGSFYSNDGIAEKIRLKLEYVPGTNTVNGRHGFEASLPEDYESQSTNPRAGTGFFKNGQSLQATTGSIQIISQFAGGNGYQPILRDKSGTQIPLLDPREWILYEYGGLVYQEMPPGIGDDIRNPGFLDCWIYIGNMVGDVTSSISSSGVTAQYNGTNLSTNTKTINISGSIVSASVNSGTNVTYNFSALQEDSRALVLLAEHGGPYEKFLSGTFHETVYVDKVFISSSIWYEDNTKAKKIYEKIINYNSNKTPSMIIRKIYADDGITVRKTAVDTITYGFNGILETSRVRNIT